MEYLEIQSIEGNKKLSCRLYDKQTSKLVVFFSGLRSKTSKAKVLYNRLTWVDQIPYSILFISDPTILNDPTLRGGYYQGSKEWFGVKYCADVILKITKMLNIQDKDVLLYGSSQGGFASLAAHIYIRKAKILAESPQNDLSIMTSSHSKADRMNMLRSVYQVSSFDQLSHDLMARNSIVKLYETNAPLTANLNIIVKETDYIHINDHIKPLISNYPQISFEVVEGEMGSGGHTAIDKSIITSRIIDLLEKQ